MAMFYGKAWEETPRDLIEHRLRSAERYLEEAAEEAEQFESRAAAKRQEAKGWAMQIDRLRAALEKLGSVD